MKNTELRERVIEAISESLDVDYEMVMLESDFEFDLGVEHLPSSDLIAALEDEFCINIDGQAMMSVHKVSDVVNLVSNRVSAWA